MSTKIKVIHWFTELDKTSIPVAGGKGANLGEMARAKFPVPPGFVVSSQAFRKFLKATGLFDEISQILAKLDVNDNKALQKASEQIQKKIVAEEMPEDVTEAVLEAYDELRKKSKGTPLVAVRSSATAEDLPDASFAGQQASYLNVDQSNLVDAVKKCWASLFTARAIFYRATQKFDHMQVSIAVVVQKMVQSEASGVMFTKHPTGENDLVIIEAVYGLGEGIVSGRYTPDHYEVEPSDLSIKTKDIQPQSQMLTFDDEENQNVEISIPSEKQAHQKVPDTIIVEVAQIGLQLQKHYGNPQDVEWACEDGKVYITQTRAVTTIPKERSRDEQSVDAQRLKPMLKGLAASPGIASGVVKIIFKVDEMDQVKDGDVMVTKMTNPDMVPAMKRAAAIVTDEGGMTSHAAIVSRELGVPCVVGTKNATKTLKAGKIITVDGKRGNVYEGDVKGVFFSKQTGSETPEAGRGHIVTATSIMVNLSTPGEARNVAGRDVDGVGLLRAEFVVGEIGIHPKKAIEDKQDQKFIDQLAEAMAQIAEAFWPRPVIYRSFDFKTNEYRSLKGGEKYEHEENNPMIGYRGASRAIADPEVFEIELKAIKRVREELGFKNLWLMMPFIRTVQEVKDIKKVLEQWGFLRDKDFKFLVMAELPSIALRIDEFAEEVDGFSIGSNDLTQLVLGVDRDNEKLAATFDERDPAVLKALEQIICGARRHGKYVGICGQAPSVYPEIVEHLVRWGISSVSVNPDVIERTRKIIAQAEMKVLLEAVTLQKEK